MVWLYPKLPKGILKIRPRSHLRYDEITRRVPTLDLGLIIFSWWRHDNTARAPGH